MQETGGIRVGFLPGDPNGVALLADQLGERLAEADRLGGSFGNDHFGLEPPRFVDPQKADDRGARLLAQQVESHLRHLVGMVERQQSNAQLVQHQELLGLIGVAQRARAITPVSPPPVGLPPASVSNIGRFLTIVCVKPISPSVWTVGG